MTARAFAVLIFCFFLKACAEPAPPVVALELPDWSDCVQTYQSDGGTMTDAFLGGDPQAARCLIALNSERGELQAEAFEYRYLIYRVEGIEPEGLDQIVRAMDRQVLAAMIGNAHHAIDGLDPIDSHPWTGCPRYDRPALALLLRAPLGEDTNCLPRGRR